MHCHTIWQEEMGRVLNGQEKSNLARFELPEPQLRWLLREYKKDSVYRSMFAFCVFTEMMMKTDRLPEDISCQAFLTKKDTYIRLAEELETLRGAWSPNEETESRMGEIRMQLYRALI